MANKAANKKLLTLVQTASESELENMVHTLWQLDVATAQHLQEALHKGALDYQSGAMATKKAEGTGVGAPLTPEEEFAASLPKPKAEEIDACIFLYSYTIGDPITHFYFEVEVAKYTALEFEIDFTGSENCELDTGGLVVKTVIQPYERKKVAYLKVCSESMGAWSYVNAYKWNSLPADEKALEAKMQEAAARHAKLAEEAKKFNFDADSLDAREIMDLCKQHNVTFYDPEFPPVVSSLYPPDDEPAEKIIAWHRPCEFFKGSFDVFLDDVEPGDIQQGCLADCWFLCSLASLAEFPELVYDCFRVPGGNQDVLKQNEYGVYEVRFCKNGYWQTVKIDDYFPCFPGAGPVYSKGHGNELWVLLLEKAYAKLHGSYSRLRTGFEYEAMMDLTGAPCSSIRFNDELTKRDIESGKFFDDLMLWDWSGYLMSCSTPGHDQWSEIEGLPPADEGVGLVAGHAYTLLECKRTRMGGHRLLCIRNPWGKFEWNGDWSDDSELWTDELRKEVGAVSDADDGLFWMCYEDFVKHFCGVNLCRARHKQSPVAPWNEHRRKGCFRYYPESSDTVTGPMWEINTDRKTTVFIAVHQEDERCATAKPYLDMGVGVLKKEDDQYVLVQSSGNSVQRQNQIEVELQPGNYIIVPTSTGCRFALAALESGPEVRQLLAGQDFVPLAETAIRELAKRFDFDMDGFLSREEVNAFWNDAFKKDISDKEHKALIAKVDNENGKVSPDGLVQKFKLIFEENKSEEPLWSILENCGYNRSLNLTGARSFVLSVHSEYEVKVNDMPWDSNIYEEAMELPIKKFGELTKYGDQQHVHFYTFQPGRFGVAFAILNKGSVALELTVDCSESENVVSHRGTLVITEVVPPNETKVLHHLIPKDCPWSWRYNLAWKNHIV